MSDVIGDQIRTDYKRVFGSPEGKNVLSDLARFTNAMVPIAPARPDLPVLVAYAEGLRAAFWHVFGMVYDELPESAGERASSTVQSPVLDAFANLRKPAT